MPDYYDLSQPIESPMTYFPGDPEPAIFPAKGMLAPWRVSELHIGTHTGTHMDAASHYFEKGRTIDRYKLDRFILPGLVAAVDGLSPDEAVENDRIDAALKQLPQGGALLIKTHWDRYWGQELYLRHPYLAPNTARSLASAGIGLLGIDALNVDSTFQGTQHVHDLVLGKDILIVENLRGLDQLVPGEIYHFSFLPLPLRGLDGSPVRAVAWKD
jgi:arylformamidase